MSGIFYNGYNYKPCKYEFTQVAEKIVGTNNLHNFGFQTLFSQSERKKDDGAT